MLYEMMAQDVITKKYKVPDEEVNKEVEKVKKTIWRSIQKSIRKLWFKKMKRISKIKLSSNLL